MSYFLKKILIVVGAAATISFVTLFPIARADANTDLLQQIANNTFAILQQVNNLPVFLQAITKSAIEWTNKDSSPTTATLQGSFTELGNLLIANMNTQTSLQQQLNADLLGSAATPATLPNANDMVYSTLLGTPFISPDPRNQPGKPPTANPPYNYLKNASGINISHTMPLPSWQGNPADKTKYSNYYSTVMAVESFGGYVLSNQYADSNQFNTLQSKLISQATNAKDWFTQVASEEIGIVLRQILLFESQSFVLLTQLLQTQRQMVTAQVMTNSILVLNNQVNESLLASKAQGVPLAP